MYSQPNSDDREDDYNTWYNDVHLGDPIHITGVVSASRFRLGKNQWSENDEGDRPPYLAIYELEADDLGNVLDAIRKARERFQFTNAIAHNSQIAVFEQITGPLS